MQIITEPQEMQETGLNWRCLRERVALVPTMGYFHEGHLSLIRWARQNSDRTVVSLFVNPTQFGPGEDFQDYPRDFERDSELARELGADVLFAPDASRMYAENYATWIRVPELSKHLCGSSRPGHFEGVCTIVGKLFNIVLPHTAVFGSKDWQQLAVVRRMARDLNMPVEVVGRPIVREEDGLALSSRNTYLDAEQRRQAPWIYAGLKRARNWFEHGEADAEAIKGGLREFYGHYVPSGQIDYIELVDAREMHPVDEAGKDSLIAVAVYLGKARLIDNILLSGE
ncbi:MAG: pantoate--beta-alanine ligase [Desulfohalobiaceae bacterium]